MKSSPYLDIQLAEIAELAELKKLQERAELCIINNKIDELQKDKL